MMTSNVTIVVAFFNSDQYRERNLNFLKDLILHLEIPLVICEQVGANKKFKKINGNNFSHLHVPTNEPFNKSKLYNLASKEIGSKYIWFVDADVVMPFAEVLSLIRNQDVIRPFKGVYMLDEDSSESFTAGASLNYSNFEVDYHYAKHSFIVKSSIFLKSGGFDESFKGWGWEDLDFCFNKLRGYIPDVFESISAVHLYHPPAPKVNERDNYFKYLDNRGVRKKLSLCFFADSFDSFNFLNFKNILSNIKHLSLSVEVCVFLSGNACGKIISSLKEIHSDYDFLKLYYHSKKITPDYEKLNASIYPAEGKKVCVADSNLEISTEMVHKMLSTKKVLSIDGLVCIDRSAFNRVNGYDSFKDLESANADLKERVLEDKKSISRKPFGEREGLQFFNFKTYSFMSV